MHWLVFVAWATKDSSRGLTKNRVFDPKDCMETLRVGGPQPRGEELGAESSAHLSLSFSFYFAPSPLYAFPFAPTPTPTKPKPQETQACSSSLLSSLPSLSCFPVFLIQAHPYLHSHTLTLQGPPPWEEGGAAFPGPALWLLEDPCPLSVSAQAWIAGPSSSLLTSFTVNWSSLVLSFQELGACTLLSDEGTCEHHRLRNRWVGEAEAAWASVLCKCPFQCDMLPCFTFLPISMD